MSDAWKKVGIEGEGGGLQAVNMRFVKFKRSVPKAYALLALFPLGAHRFYLWEPKGAAAYLLLTIVAITTYFVSANLLYTLYAAIPALLFVAFDLFWIEKRVIEANKRLRMKLYMGNKAAPPKGYKGRYTDDKDPEAMLQDYLSVKESEKGGHQPVDMDALEKGEKQKKVLSFNEQEKLLREMAKARKQKK